MLKRKCKYCGKSFIAKHHNTKYCSIYCRNKYLSYGKAPESGIHKCIQCGKSYYYIKGQKNWFGKKGKLNKKDSGKRADLFCCYECGKKYSQLQTTKTVTKKYGVTNVSKLKSIQKKKEKTCLAHYGVKNPSKSPAIVRKMLKTAEKTKTNRLIKVKETWNKKSKKEKKKIQYKREQTCLKKYKVKSIFETDKLKKDKSIARKRILSKKRNGTLTTSKAELKIKALLERKFKIVEYQYKSELYPFYCDFYIPLLDLYIEYQGTWTHGKKPYTATKEDLAIVNTWKQKNTLYYRNAIDVWTRRDPLKRKIAKNNHLNWIEFFTIEQFIEWYDKI